MVDKVDLEYIFNKCEIIFKQIKNKRILVTGGTGFLGKWLLESLIYANDKLGLDAKVSVLTRDPDKFFNTYPLIARHSCIELQQGDIRNFGYKYKYAYIIHLATDVNHRHTVKNKNEMLSIIGKGTWNILENAKHMNAKILFVSSGIVEHEHDNPYVMGKRFAEDLCRVYRTQFKTDVKVARGYSFVGAYLPLDKHFAIGNFIENAINNKSIVVKSDGSAVRSYMYCADAITSFLYILEYGSSEKLYHVGSNESVSILEVAQIIGELSGTKVKVLNKENQGIRAYYNKYFDNDLNVGQSLGLEESLRRTLKWFKEN